LSDVIEPVWLINLLNCIVTLLVLAPFLLGLIRHGSRTQVVYAELWQQSRSNRIAIVTWTLLRIFSACMFVVAVLSRTFNATLWVLLPIAVVVVFFLGLSHNVLLRYVRLEENFMHNLNAKEQEAGVGEGIVESKD
jgi:CPA2 family monovalent cation:H+ antiporter-2